MISMGDSFINLVLLIE